MCFNGRVKVEITGPNEGCESWTAVRRRPALRAQRFGVRNDSSVFGHQSYLPFSSARRPQTWKHSRPGRHLNPKKCDQIRVNPGKSDLKKIIGAHEK